MTEGPHRLAIRVYYEDTDFSGVVYHANYLRFLERGRTEWLRAQGVEQAALRDPTSGEALAFAVRQMTLDFRKPARMDDEVTVETAVVELGGASLSLRQEIQRGDDLLVAASVRIACVAMGRARRLPADLFAKIRRPTAWLTRS